MAHRQEKSLKIPLATFARASALHATHALWPGIHVCGKHKMSELLNKWPRHTFRGPQCYSRDIR